MSRAGTLLNRWGPAVLMMLLIFGFSSLPAAELPDFGFWDFAAKKGAHAVGYGLLGLAYLRGLEGRRTAMRIAWALSVLYSLTDEFHQSFVPGRHPSPLDIGIDALGSGIALALRSAAMRRDAARTERSFREGA